MAIWYIRHDDYNGENKDLFVESESQEQAIIAWDRHYGSESLPASVRVMDLTNAKRDVNGVLDWDFVIAYQ